MRLAARHHLALLVSLGLSTTRLLPLFAEPPPNDAVIEPAEGIILSGSPLAVRLELASTVDGSPETSFGFAAYWRLPRLRKIMLLGQSQWEATRRARWQRGTVGVGVEVAAARPKLVIWLHGQAGVDESHSAVALAGVTTALWIKGPLFVASDARLVVSHPEQPDFVPEAGLSIGLGY